MAIHERATTTHNDAPMFVKVFLLGRLGNHGVRFAEGGHDGDGPLPVGVQALIRSRSQQGYGDPGAVGRSVKASTGCGSRSEGQAAPEAVMG